MAECIYNLDGPDDLPESPESVEFLCTEPDKPPPKVHDPLEVINLGTEEDPRPIQISGLLETNDRAKIVCLLQEFKDYYQGNTNNQAEYEALIIGLEILIELGAIEVEVFGDSKLVINQLNGEYKCRHITMAGYYLVATQLLSYWDSEVSVNHVPRESNLAANEMAQIASGNLLRKTPDGLLLKCLGQEESMKVMADVHEGICGAHQVGTKMGWLIRRYGYFWPDVEKNCKSYA
ncbi:unnamed protein product [Malus baccata var. baccata]